jgi:hypothetical protein
VPPLLVEFHVLGSVVLWVMSLLTYFALFQRPRADREVNPADPASVDAATGVVVGVETVK